MFGCAGGRGGRWGRSIGRLQLVTDELSQQSHRKILRLLSVFRVLTAQLRRPWSGWFVPGLSRPVCVMRLGSPGVASASSVSPSHRQVPNYIPRYLRCRRGGLQQQWQCQPRANLACRGLYVAACHAATRRHVSPVGHARSGLLSWVVCCRVAVCYAAQCHARRRRSAVPCPPSTGCRPSAVRGPRVGGGLRRSIGRPVVVASCGSTCIPAGAKLSNLRRVRGQRKDVSCRIPPSCCPKQESKPAPGRGLCAPNLLLACTPVFVTVAHARPASAPVWCC